MAYKNEWTRIGKLKSGGQGATYLVTNRPPTSADPTTFVRLFTSANNISVKKPRSTKDNERLSEIGEQFLEWIATDQRRQQPPLAVEKVLHKPESSEELKKKRDRLQVEISVLEAVSHSNLVKLLDHDIDALSYVLEYYPNGTLADKTKYQGRVLASLLAMRPLIEGLCKLHELGFSHRDIKPENIFIGNNGQFVLGDFGIVFDANRGATRITEETEKVGTTDYMPPWLRREFTEEIPPSVDVFAVGKILHEMISGRRLHFWYLDRPDFFLPDLFPESSAEIWLAHDLLKKCVCENRESCLPDASALLKQVDRTIFILQRHGQFIGHHVRRHCTVCADGVYVQMPQNKMSADVGGEFSGNTMRFACVNCGHVQTFFFERGNKPSAWIADE